MRGLLREHVRDEIREELAKHKPVETARLPLELIAETSIRFVEEGGSARYQVIDEDGRPRTKVVEGRAVDLTIPDLVAELRANHPALFQPANDAGVRKSDQGSDASEPDRADAAGISATDQAEGDQEKPRDWLMLTPSSSHPAGGEQSSAAIERAESHGKASVNTSAPVHGGPETPNQLGDRQEALADQRVSHVGQPAPAAPRIPSRVLYGAMAGAAAVLLVGLWVFNTEPRSSAKDLPSQSATATAARPPAEPATTGTVPPNTPNAPSGAAPNPGVVSGVPEVIDTSTLRIDGKVVRLFGVEWSRGAQAEDLTRYLRGREVACRPAPAADTHRCQVEGRDLSEVVLFNGGGRVTANATPDLVAAENHARTERVGIWRK